MEYLIAIIPADMPVLTGCGDKSCFEPSVQCMVIVDLSPFG